MNHPGKVDSTAAEQQRRKREKIVILCAIPLIIALSVVEYFLVPGRGPIPAGGSLAIFAIINVNILLILLLLFLIVRNLVKLIFEDRQNVLGAKLRTKMVIAFVSLSLLPTVTLFFVSYEFLKTSLNYWFDVKVERSLHNALIVGRTFYEERVSQLQATAQTAGRYTALKCITGNSTIDVPCVQQAFGSMTPIPGGGRGGEISIHSLELLSESGEKIYSKTWLPLVEDVPPIRQSIIEQAVKEQGPVVTGTRVDNGELIRALRPVRDERGEVIAILVLGNLIPSNLSQMLDDIRKGYEDYKQLKLFQNPMRAAVLVNLLLITLIILFFSIWLGFRLAKGITEPVQMLAEATYRVAQGDLDFSLKARGKDELSSLVKAFNTMTKDLKEARRRAMQASRDLQKSYQELEQRQRYIEIILQNVAAGVISIDAGGVVTTVNRSAERILGISAREVIGKPYQVILPPDQAEEFESIKNDLRSSSRGTLQRSIRLKRDGRDLFLIASFTQLKDQEGNPYGVVVVFDDMTELEKIQRMAAWREVARRIAHEVKNPLTPIQLSAERLRRKCMGELDDDLQGIFDRCTRTIITQTEELRRLVNEFSNFARMPAPRLRPVDLKEVLEEVVIMYKEGHPGIEFKFEADEVPKALFDQDQIKRAVINLLDNSVAATGEGGTIAVQVELDHQEETISISVSDTGTGVRPEDRDRLFEPYFSRKKDGTGLGLAIVSSIVSDHEGTITVKPNVPRGTVFTMTFPLKWDNGSKEERA